MFIKKKEKEPTQNNARRLIPGEKYNVISCLDREIYHQGSFLTFDEALNKTIRIMKSHTTNSQMEEFTQEFNPNQRNAQYTYDDFGLAFDRKRNYIQAWSNIKGDADVKVLVF